MLIVGFGEQGYPYVYDFLTALAYGFLLPVVAVIHVRNVPVRQSGAILGTLAGAAVATVGLAGSANVDVRSASLFVLGLWWWTIGKIAAETGVLPRSFGVTTAVMGALALLLVPLEAFSPALAAVMPRSLADALAQPYFSVAHVAMAGWLFAIAGVLARGTRAA
ncbi:MAG TPA: hypothetical protein VHG53_07495 [Candidatus Limnocylindria bacterium]|nr:hypothetical protein [Candidatus Limnocylindria bacterium]